MLWCFYCLWHQRDSLMYSRASCPLTFSLTVTITVWLQIAQRHSEYNLKAAAFLNSWVTVALQVSQQWASCNYSSKQQLTTVVGMEMSINKDCSSKFTTLSSWRLDWASYANWQLSAQFPILIHLNHSQGLVLVILQVPSQVSMDWATTVYCLTYQLANV